jgi:mycothiol synthase
MSVRAATLDDLDAVLELIRTDEETLTGRASTLGLSDLKEWLKGVELERSTWLHEEGGPVLAFGWADLRGQVGVTVGIVHQAAKGRGLGSALITASEERLRDLAASRVHAVTLAADTAAPALFALRGYREARRFYELAIHLEGAPDVPALPEGLVLEPVQDMRTMHAVMEEGFQDHWEHQARTYEDWWERRSASPDFDPSLWWWIRDGDEIAAGIENFPNRNGGGYVGALATRPPWRGRGLARTLLLHTFSEFHRRGSPRVTLGVDAENPTGATALYESVGMERELEQVVYEKLLT